MHLQELLFIFPLANALPIPAVPFTFNEDQDDGPFAIFRRTSSEETVDGLFPRNVGGAGRAIRLQSNSPTRPTLNPPLMSEEPSSITPPVAAPRTLFARSPSDWESEAPSLSPSPSPRVSLLANSAEDASQNLGSNAPDADESEFPRKADGNIIQGKHTTNSRSPGRIPPTQDVSGNPWEEFRFISAIQGGPSGSGLVQSEVVETRTHNAQKNHQSTDQAKPTLSWLAKFTRVFRNLRSKIMSAYRSIKQEHEIRRDFVRDLGPLPLPPLDQPPANRRQESSQSQRAVKRLTQKILHPLVFKHDTHGKGYRNLALDSATESSQSSPMANVQSSLLMEPLMLNIADSNEPANLEYTTSRQDHSPIPPYPQSNTNSPALLEREVRTHRQRALRRAIK